MDFEISKGSNPKHTGMTRLKTAALAALALALVATVIGVIVSSTSGTVTSLPRCENRLVIVDLSSSARSPQLAALAEQTIDDAAVSSVVCGTQLSAFGLAGGGQISTIISSSDLGAFSVIGENATVRNLRFTNAQRGRLTGLVARNLTQVYDRADAHTTSIAALYNFASQIATERSHVVFLTTGVQDDSSLSLNVPLASGEGTKLARRLTIPKMTAASLVVIGIAQVDAATAPPSALWAQEVYNFNVQLARRSGAPDPRVISLASPMQFLTF